MSDLKPGLGEAERRVEALRDEMYAQAESLYAQGRYREQDDRLDAARFYTKAIDAIRGNDETD